MAHYPVHPHVTQEGFLAYIRAIADRSPLPIVPYLKTPLDEDGARRLADIPGRGGREVGPQRPAVVRARRRRHRGTAASPGSAARPSSGRRSSGPSGQSASPAASSTSPPALRGRSSTRLKRATARRPSSAGTRSGRSSSCGPAGRTAGTWPSSRRRCARSAGAAGPVRPPSHPVGEARGARDRGAARRLGSGAGPRRLGERSLGAWRLGARRSRGERPARSAPAPRPRAPGDHGDTAPIAAEHIGYHYDAGRGAGPHRGPGHDR